MLMSKDLSFFPYLGDIYIFKFQLCVRSPFRRRGEGDELNKGELVRIFVTGVAKMFIVHIHLQRERM